MAAKPWFKESPSEMGKTVQTLVDSYRKDQQFRRTNYVKNLEMFECRRMAGYSAHTYYGGTETEFDGFDQDRRGLIRSSVETAAASIYGPQHPKPQFQTTGATWDLRRRVYRLDRIVQGILSQRQDKWSSVWPLMHDAGTEAALQGTACIWTYADLEQKRIGLRQVPHVDVFVDPLEGRTPKNYFMRVPMDEYAALERWPSQKKAIDAAKDYDFTLTGNVLITPRVNRTIETFYAWRVANGEDNPGVFAIVINGVVVEHGEWTAPEPPIVFLHWEPCRDGFWGSGIGNIGRRRAREISDLDIRLNQRERVASRQLIFYEANSVNPDELVRNDATIAIAMKDGAQPPVIQNTVPFSPMEVDFFNGEVAAYWDAIGVSQVSAAARREQGLSSGVALMTLNDTKASRQIMKARRFEEAFVDLARQIVWRLRELADTDPDFTVTWPGLNTARTYKWMDSDIPDQDIRVSVMPASNLPQEPAGRQQMVASLQESGLVSPDDARTLTGWPDVDALLDSDNAESEYIDMLIERYLDADQETWSDGDLQAPEGFLMNKMGALKKFTGAWCRAKIDQGCLPPEEAAKAEFNISLLENWMKQLIQLMARSAPPQPPQGAPPQAAPAPQQAA